MNKKLDNELKRFKVGEEYEIRHFFNSLYNNGKRGECFGVSYIQKHLNINYADAMKVIRFGLKYQNLYKSPDCDYKYCL